LHRKAGLGAAAAVLAFVTAARNADYRSEQALWSAAARSSPNKARVWNNLGYAHALAGDLQAARSAYAKALQLDPAHGKAAANLRALDQGASQH